MEIFLGDITIGENEINAGSLSIPLVKGDKGDKRRHRCIRLYSSKTEQTIGLRKISQKLNQKLKAICQVH